MRYTTKLYLFFTIVSLIGLTTAFTIIIREGYETVFYDLVTTGKSIAGTTATHLNGDLVEQIRVQEDEKKPAYKEVRDFLRKSRDANRNESIYIKFIYTTYPDPKDPKKFLFGVDAEETEKDLSHAGTVNEGATKDILYEHLSDVYSYGKLVKDQWGTWLTSYAPILNSKGQYVASVGVDISAAFVNRLVHQMLMLAAMTLSFSLLLALIAAFFLARRATEALALLKLGAEEIGKGNFAHRINIQTKDEFQELADGLNKMAQGLMEKEKMKSGFAHYVSKHVMEKIMTQGAPNLGGERKKITVFFCDIRGFTQISEKLPPEQVMSILNEYFQAMLDIVFKHNGTIDKLIGDAIMAEFGFPVDDPEQEKNAVLTAIDMQQALALLRVKWKNEGKPEIEIGIGIHSGEAVVGTLGSAERVEFTAIGDTVNIASRLESATREFNEKIIVSEATYNALGGAFPGKNLGPVTLKGIEKPIIAYAILPLQ